MKKITAWVGGSFMILLFVGACQLANAHGVDDRMSADILMYVNQYRAEHGLSPLAMNDALSHEAAKHSRDMAQHRLPFGHDGFNNRISRLHQHIPASASGAENVAYNYKTARIVVDGWIKSPGHRQNIVGHYNLTGIGVARDNNGKIYYTQMFLRADNRQETARQVPVHAHPIVIQSNTHTHSHRAYS